MKKRMGLTIFFVLLACLSNPAHGQAQLDAFTFFVPYHPDELSAQFQAAQNQPIDEDLVITISVSVLRPDTTLVYYDHWEDGLEPNTGIRTQNSTEVWGNNDPSDGAPQNIPADVFAVGSDVAVQRSLIDVPVSDPPSTPYPYDGGDQIVSVGGSIAVTMVAWPEILPFDIPGYLFAGAWELYPTSRWGTEYVIPVGENLAASRPGFKTVGLNVQAVEDGTVVDIDDPISGFQETVTLDRGENHRPPVGINAGTTVRASEPVQVHVFTGSPLSRYEARAYTMVPLDQWTGDYLAPRSSDGDFWLFNPNDTDLEVTVETTAGTNTVTVPANGNASYPVAVSPTATGMRFTASDNFYGVAALDDADVQDWGYALQPVANLTSQVLVGFAPGNRFEPPSGDPPPQGTTGFEARVYVTATEATTVTVDYEGDGSRVEEFGVQPLEEVDIADPEDFDMTGARLYTDGVPFVAVWGQDQDANTGDPSIDVGTNIVPLRALSIQKTYTLVEEGYNCGTASQPNRIQFELQAFNDSTMPIPNLVVTDNLPWGMRYVPGTTTLGGSSIPDDNGGFPLENGYSAGTLDAGDSVLITFDALLDVTDLVENQADVVPPSDPAVVELSPPFWKVGYEINKTLVDPPSGPVDPGQVITFNVMITNTGSVNLTHLPLRDEFDVDDISFLGASEPPDVVDTDNGVITWNDLTSSLGDLAPGEALDLGLTFVVDSFETSILNVAVSEGVQGSDGFTQTTMCDVAELYQVAPTSTPAPTGTPPPTPTSTSTETPTLAPPPPTAMPQPTPTNTPQPPAERVAIMIEVQNYLDYRTELISLGPFWVYGWAADAQIGGFEDKLAALQALADDPNVTKRAVMFSSYDSFAARVDRIPMGIGVFYNSEPGLSADYSDIFLEDENNSVVKFAALAKANGLEAQWGPLTRNLDTHTNDGVSDTAISLMFQAGLDGVGWQAQQLIDDACVEDIVHGPFQVGGQGADSIEEVYNRLRRLSERELLFGVQVMPGYAHSEGCYPGDSYAEANCGTDIEYTYQHCHDFVAELTQSNLVDSVSIWASQTQERAQLVPLVEALRNGR